MSAIQALRWKAAINLCCADMRHGGDVDASTVPTRRASVWSTYIQAWEPMI